MLKMTVAVEEYLMIGDNIKIVFVGKAGNYIRIMVDAPKDVNIVRSTVLERSIKDPEERKKLPKYYRQEEHPEKYVRKHNPGRNGSQAEQTPQQETVQAPQREARQKTGQAPQRELPRKPACRKNVSIVDNRVEKSRRQQTG